MNKLITISFVLLLTLGFFHPIEAKAATEVKDQSCIINDVTGPTVNSIYDDAVKITQSFTPSKNRLTKISVLINGSSSYDFWIDLYYKGSLIASTERSSSPDTIVYVSQRFSQPVTVTPGDGNYRIAIRSDLAPRQWHRTSGCYSGGMAYYNNDPLIDANTDFGFVTFGYDATATDDSVDNSQATAEQDQLSNSNVNAQNTNQNKNQGKIAKEKQNIISGLESMPLWQQFFYLIAIFLIIAGISYLIFEAVKRKKKKI